MVKVNMYYKGIDLISYMEADSINNGYIYGTLYEYGVIRLNMK